MSYELYRVIGTHIMRLRERAILSIKISLPQIFSNILILQLLSRACRLKFVNTTTIQRRDNALAAIPLHHSHAAIDYKANFTDAFAERQLSIISNQFYQS